MTEIAEFQLVLQLPGSSKSDFEDLIGLETELRAAVGDLGLVDGHDMGVGEMNIFILTSKPIEVFERAKTLPAIRRVMPRMKAAYRSIDGDEYEILHPLGLYKFEVR